MTISPLSALSRLTYRSDRRDRQGTGPPRADGGEGQLRLQTAAETGGDAGGEQILRRGLVPDKLRLLAVAAGQHKGQPAPSESLKVTDQRRGIMMGIKFSISIDLLHPRSGEPSCPDVDPHPGEGQPEDKEKPGFVLPVQAHMGASRPLSRPPASPVPRHHLAAIVAENTATQSSQKEEEEGGEPTGSQMIHEVDLVLLYMNTQRVSSLGLLWAQQQQRQQRLMSYLWSCTGDTGQNVRNDQTLSD
ncbi:hypothetical protein D4764_21G0003770 [Takifugu flavidus]|uniref:Uncharacterized protein n=1 Tax=Takifugu flavidus TaxID=433684 RepID=A0A5C6NIN3_9TELE|nr:hypothetical protein D4764_21G0003770 [Takifugu flavidus]